MISRRFVSLLFCAAALTSCASTHELSALALDNQVYPTGVITTVRADWAVSEKRTLSLHAGTNFTHRDDNGEHDKEESGQGPGLGVSGRYYWNAEQLGWFAGGRLDLWFLDINWQNLSGARGQTDVVVLQPTGLGGYRWKLGESPWRLDLYAALGLEINVSTSGEDVGDGGIGLLGVSLTYSL